MKRIAFPTLLSVAVSSLLACSGVSDPGVTGNPGMTQVDSGSVADTGSPGNMVGDEKSSTTIDTGTGTTPPAGTDAGLDATTSGPDAAPDTGQVGPPDTGTAPDTGVVVVDAGGDAGATFSCGAATMCVTGTETCCVQPAAGGGGGVTAACQTGTTCPAGDTALHCTATSDCATGMECCVIGGGGMAAASASMCRAACPGVQLCDPMAADPGCPMQTPNCMRPAAGNAGGGARVPANVGTCQ